MSDLAFADATRPALRVILGVPLLNYSLGHELLLFQQRNLLLLSKEAFAELEEQTQRAALFRAVMVCSRSWNAGPRHPWWFKWWRWRARGEDYPSAIAEFRVYREEGSAFPKMREDPGDKKADRHLGAPYLARLTNFALERFPRTCFDEPFGFLQYLYFSKAEEDGSCMVENATERQIREEIEGHRAAYEAEKAQTANTGGAQGLTRPTSDCGQLASPGTDGRAGVAAAGDGRASGEGEWQR